MATSRMTGKKIRLLMTRTPMSCLLILTFIASLISCSSPTLEALSPDEIIDRSVRRMQSLGGFHFVIDRSGSPAFIDVEGLLAFRRAEGDYVFPDKAQATIRVIGPGLVTEVQIISIANTQWETNMLTGKWQQLPPDWGFNPASLFDQDIGIQPILKTDLQELVLVGQDELEETPGVMLYALKGEVLGETLYRLSYGMIGPERMVIQLWIAPETFELYRLRLVDPQPEADEPTIWQMDFWNFDETVEIMPPESEGGGL